MKIYREVKGLPEPEEVQDEGKQTEQKEEKPSFDVVIGDVTDTKEETNKAVEEESNEE